ncbi:MAG: DUF262 domain-containing protein [Verrucomicrobiaceae bacterium]|nr:MAG: DUF262 domain-containing protein [Verrucomicrobiaceae bacterium]
MSEFSSPVESSNPTTFNSIFFPGDRALPLSVPDYQRAYSWEEKQTALFIADLAKYHSLRGKYYFGHFIVELDEDTAGRWEIVDGQQRITTFVLFLMVCRVLMPAGDHAAAYEMIDRFSTVSYDRAALEAIAKKLPEFFAEHDGTNWDKNTLAAFADKQIVETFSLEVTGDFTRSQHRIVLALLRFHHAFGRKGPLRRELIPDYIRVITAAKCSHHLATDKSVAVNIFEMHNTRGIPLSTVEVIKAKLMKFVHDYGGASHKKHVAKIQEEFGRIFGMEESLAAHSFRGDMTMEQLLRLHLRVIDDGGKLIAGDVDLPRMNASNADLIAYVEDRLQAALSTGDPAGDTPAGVLYAVNLATEFRRSIQIMSSTLRSWDAVQPLVGDVLILERELSCEFFLIVCRRLQSKEDMLDGRLDESTLLLWEKLLFTRDFHGSYYNLKGGRDNFPELFDSIESDEASIVKLLQGYLANGFRPDRTADLQRIVIAHLNEYEHLVLNKAYDWWRHKMIYTIYKYETHLDADLRRVMKGTISVEHLLPRNWTWMRKEGEDRILRNMPDEDWDKFRKGIDACIDGIGNLLLLTPGENTSASDHHPAKKSYDRYATGGSYEDHHLNREKWLSCHEWENLIRKRGEKIFHFMRTRLLGEPDTPPPTPEQ